MKKRSFPTLVRVSTSPEPYGGFNGRTEGLFQSLNETRMPMTVTVFTQPIMNFLANVFRPRGKKKNKKSRRTKTFSIYTKIQKIYRLRTVRLKKEKSIAFLYY